MTAPRLDLRIPAEMKERWQAETHAQGLTLTAFIVRKVEGQRLPPELEGSSSRCASIFASRASRD
jgi:hypothetical protein